MKRTEIIFAPLASLKAQEKYIIHGTKDNYYLPEELLESALEAIEKEEENEITANLKILIKNFEFPENYSARKLVLENESWKNIREASAAFLSSRKFNIDAWEENEL
jgi:hypothetical protein